jgi:HEAT repeat protein
VKPLGAAEVADVIKAGRDAAFKTAGNPYAERSTPELLAGLSSWSPVVRRRSAVALAARDENLLPQVIALLEGSDRLGRYGACEALGAMGPRADAAGPQLRAALAESDPWLVSLAAQAILTLGPAERKASVSDLLAVTTRSIPADPRRHAALHAGIVLFSHFPGARPPVKSILEESLDGADREQLHEALRALLHHEDSIARGAAGSTYGRFTDEDIVALLPDITYAVEKLAPSNEMFGDGIRIAGLDLLSRLHVTEGMELCVAVIEPDRWGAGKRLGRCCGLLTRYGTHAKAVLPQLRDIRGKFVAKRASPADIKAIDDCIAAIESSTNTPTLVSIKDFGSRAL